jgi:uncharacterized protein YdeI (YjbR/CyaY-like superfamily)
VSRRLDQLERVEIASIADLRAWLAANHGRAQSVWLVTARKQAGARYVAYSGIVEELLCFGWIDSLPRALDPMRTMLLISPRKPGSNWSKDDRARVEWLERDGRMASAGAAVVAAARRDGSWDRLKTTETGTAPADLLSALSAAGAVQQWDAFSLAVRRRSLEFLTAAKRPETRTKRIATIVAAAADGTDPTSWKPKG